VSVEHAWESRSRMDEVHVDNGKNRDVLAAGKDLVEVDTVVLVYPLERGLKGEVVLALIGA
jgi:hypothetical protein